MEIRSKMHVIAVALMLFARYASSATTAPPAFCPPAQPMLTFDYLRMEGHWYLLYMWLDIGFSCFTYDVTATDDGYSTSVRNYYLSNGTHMSSDTVWRIDEPGTLTYVSGFELSAVSGGRESLLVLDVPYSIIGSADMIQRLPSWNFTVVDADYDNYEMTVSCIGDPSTYHGLSFNVYITSREKQLDNATLDRLFGELRDIGIDPNQLTRLDQINCPPPQDTESTTPELDDAEETTNSYVEETTNSDVEETTTSDVEETTTSDVEETTTSDVEETTTSDVEETTTSDVEETTTSDVEETTTSDVEETTTSDVEETTTSDVEETTTSTLEESTTTA